MTNKQENSSGNTKASFGFIIIAVFMAAVIALAVKSCGGGPDQAVASVSETTTTTAISVSSTTIPEQETTTTTTEVPIADVTEEQVVAMSGSYEPEQPPRFAKPTLITVPPDMRVGLAKVVLRSSRLIDEAGSVDVLTITAEVPFLGNINTDALFTPDYEAYKLRVLLPSSYIVVEPVPNEAFEWNGEDASWPVQVVEVLSDGTVGETRALPDDAAVAFLSEGEYRFSKPVQKLLFRAAESNAECVLAARNTMRRMFMDKVYESYENKEKPTARELIEEVVVSETIETHEFSTDGIAEEMLRLEGGVWGEFELVSVSCGGE